ncbi:site-specific integrase [Caballeronia novacaledonica]|uniref:Tyrosine-type recombinase/integrase n=1 Tax=Caballeronia novacaledonica TaxID=1544861 RepID=A0AA37I5D8_9BURK|nr:site-specific integrase [Caballeronia novacaledonica]GJH23800.1 tyrosine-type recombinase/integrase [Caballeronia novacaledonica]
MALLHVSSIVSVKLKYAWQKSKGSLLFFKRRVPDDIKPLLPAGSKYAGKVHYVVSLQTADPRIAAKLIPALVHQTDEDWAQLRNPTREGVLREAHELLLRNGVDPSNPQGTPEALDHFHTFLEHHLPRSVLENEDITDGRQLDRYLTPVQAAAFQMIQGRVKVTLEDCLEQYVTARPETEKDARLVFRYLFAFLETRAPVAPGTREIRSVTRQDVNGFVAWLLAGNHSPEGKRISTSTVDRYLTPIKAAFARANRENQLGMSNVFERVEIPKAGKDIQKRETFTVDQYRCLHRALEGWATERGPDQVRCILTLVAETGARLAEITGLAAADVHPKASVPYLELKTHPWRSLKTQGSARRVPLTPLAMETVKAALKLANGSPFLFPNYASEEGCKSDSASATLVQWVRSREGLKGTKLGNHSLRHGMEDLLRAAGCPDSARDQITGHATPGMGAKYGEGYPLAQLAEWLTKATDLVHAEPAEG